MIAESAAFVPLPVATFLLTSETTAEAISAHIPTTSPPTVQVVSRMDPSEPEKLAALEPHVRRVQVIHVEALEALDPTPAHAPHVRACCWTQPGRMQQSQNWAEPAAPTIR